MLGCCYLLLAIPYMIGDVSGSKGAAPCIGICRNVHALFGK